MNEWKELKIDDLPPGILTGDYEFGEYDTPSDIYIPSTLTVLRILSNMISVGFIYYYRKPEPKQPSHEEIMKNGLYWQCDNSDYWRKITGFRVLGIKGINQYLINNGWCNREYFINRKSADIPPETL
jgi:hypothetical protein